MSGQPTGEHAEEESATRDQRADPEVEPFRLASNGDGPNGPSDHERGPAPPNWVEKGTLVALFLALIAAGAAAFEADRLARDTEQALSDARIAALNAHLDNLRIEEITARDSGIAQVSADAAKKSANAAEIAAGATVGQLGEMKAEQRPIVSIAQTTVSSPLTFNQTGAHLRLKFLLGNAGKSTASFVISNGDFYVRAPDYGVTQRQMAICRNLKKRPIGPKGAGVTVFPGRQEYLFGIFNMPLMEFPKLKQIAAGDSRVGVAAIAGCVDYVWGKIHFGTGFIWEVDKGTEEKFTHIDPAAGDIPPDQVLLLVNPALAATSD